MRSYRNLLNSYKFQGIVNLFTAFQVELDDFASAFHQCIETLRAGVATMQAWKRSQVIALLIALDYNREFPLGFLL